MKPSAILMSVVAGLAGALVIDLFGVPALILVTLLLLLGIALRSRVAVLACAIACGVTLALWVLAVSRCDAAIQNCTLETPALVLFAWLALGLVVGAAATVYLVAMSRPG